MQFVSLCAHQVPLNRQQTAILRLGGGGGGGNGSAYMGPTATTWVPMGAQIPIPNDHPNPSQGQQKGFEKIKF